ncbi:transposase, partial [Gemella morbillorum]
MDIIKKHFPNARIIIDRFHIIQNINRELNKERVRLMNIYRGKKGKEGRNYTILKNFWRLVLADEDKIDYEKYFYNRSFGKLVTRRDVLNYILSLDKSFRA